MPPRIAVNSALSTGHVVLANPGELTNSLSIVELFLLDLDGTTTIENELLPGTSAFIERLSRTGRDFVFLTNNTSTSSRHYVEKVNRLGIAAQPGNVFTAGQSTALHLLERKDSPRVFLVGTRALCDEFAEFGIEVAGRDDDRVDFVVVGFDRELEYWKLERACELIHRGVPFVATHPDLVCPLKEHRFIPDCGAICEMIEHAVGRKPVHFGKPNKAMAEILARRKGVRLDRMAMIGDRLYTDIALGVNAGITSVCVLSGESSREDIQSSQYRPTFVVESIADVVPCIPVG